MNFFRPGPPLRIKICGITSEEDADMAIHAGADALGFNFYPGSKRHIELTTAQGWIGKLAGRVDRVAVVVNPAAAEVAALKASGCFEAIQFHGDESPAFCEQAGFSRWIRGIRVKGPEDISQAQAYTTPFLLYDAWSATNYGGTGARLNWDIMRDVVLCNQDRKIILAGGLNPNNVRDAVRIVRPHAVDVASGVELIPRRKDEYLVREFIRAARLA